MIVSSSPGQGNSLRAGQLPIGFQVRVVRGARTLDGGRLVVGGSPTTAFRLSARAVAMVSSGLVTVVDEHSAALADRLLATNLAMPELGGVSPASPDELTVVVPVRDRPLQLERTLAVLRPLRCVVVDDGSRDRRRVADVAARHGAEIVSLPVNQGPAAARNAGLRQVRTPYVAFVDSDVTASSAQLLVLTRHFADPAVVLVGPRVTGRTRSARARWFELYEEQHSSLTHGPAPAVVRPGGAVGWLPGACLVGRVDALGGGFDADLRVGEDVDLVWRITGSGGRVRYEPDVEVLHDNRRTALAWLRRKVLYGTSAAPLADRHGTAVAPAVLSAELTVGAASLLLRRRSSPVVAGAALALSARRMNAALPKVPERNALAGQFAVRALGWAVRQESSLLLRHWWPATLVLLPSRSVRRALVSALVVDVAVSVAQEYPRPERLPYCLLVVCRLLDDLAYGAGLWIGAVRSRSLRSLLPRFPRR